MIVVECDPDEFLVKSVGFPRKLIKHESGKGKVLGIINKKQAIGIIDEDPDSSQPREMKKYIEKEAMGAIKLLIRKDDDGKRIIQISPYLEQWLLHRARQNGISAKDFGLPDDPKEMHDITHIERNINFQKFLSELIKIDDEIKTIRKWINEAIV